MQQTEYLERQLEEYREADRQRNEEWLEERRQRETERKAEAEIRARTASSWPEALQKQIRLYGEEAAYEAREPGTGTWFTDGIKACKRAHSLWPQAEEAIRPQIEALQKEIDDLRGSIRHTVAGALEVEGAGNPAWEEVSRALREDDPTDWLQW